MNSIKIICLFLVYVFCLSFFYIDKKVKVVIDAGHGGKDNGAVIDSISEKDIVYSISQKIKSLENHNLEVILLRKDDRFLTLTDRVKKIKSINPDLVLSLHIDSNLIQSKSSIKAYIFKNEMLKKSHYHATKILNQLNQNKDQIEFADFHILKASSSPAVSLTLGNFNNKEDMAILTSEIGQNDMAERIIKSLQ